jgi:3,4-dihydroxy 2-butanone 4-phosphate synthase/GTP cyclohydrolase II
LLRTLRPDADFATVEDAVAEIRRGRMVVVVDDEERENEGDLVMAAERCQPEHVAFMRQHGSGVVCVPMSAERLQALDLPQMVERNEAPLGTAFAVSVDARSGITTGISAADRALTIRLIADPRTAAHDLARPGHVFPLRARPGGVLERAGQTEAAVDLCAIAGLTPVGVICEITNDDGSMARLPALRRFARRHGLALIRVRDLVGHRLTRESLVQRIASSPLATRYGDFTAHRYRARFGSDAEHLALTIGDVGGREVFTQLHDECVNGDTFGAVACECRDQMESALRRIAAEGRGVFVYLRRGDRAGRLIGAEILRDLGVRRSDRVRLASA